MTAALAATRAVVIRPAPHREPPFEDETAPTRAGRSTWDEPLPFGQPPRHRVWLPRTASTRDMPEPAAWSRRLLIGITEIAAGRRPLHQLTGMLSPSIAAGLGAEFERSTAVGGRHWLHRATVGTVRGCEPVDGVAELCAVLDTGDRVRAVALRLDVRHGRWRCVRLQLG